MRHILPLLFVALLPLAATAATPAAPATPATPAALQPLVKDGGTVTRNFPAVDGLRGWIVQYQGRTLIIFTTPSGDYAFSSPLLDKTGTNLTQQYYEKYVMTAAADDTAAALTQDPYLIDEGPATAPLVYIYADANCSYCNQLWTKLHPLVQSGKLHVRWALVAFLKKSSVGRAAAILAAPDRAAALAKDETDFDHGQEEGGMPELTPVPDGLKAAIDAHDRQMASAGGQGTPFLVYRKGGQWSVHEGMPQDMPAFIAALDPH
jgi:thiol:disulfide interchange protein DsbG